jgi:hypothetical protein
MHPHQPLRSFIYGMSSTSAFQLIVVLCSLLASNSVFAADDEPISVAVSVPASSATNGNRMIRSGTADAHFHVVVTNGSEKPRRIWRDDCSWGYAALSFEITDDTGKTWTVEKKPRGWLANEPFYWILEPHENLVIDVYFTNGATWNGFPEVQPHERKVVSMRAIFDIKPDDESRRQEVWTGRVQSQSRKYTFLN